MDVALSAHNPEVAGSNPAPATNVVAGQKPFLIQGPFSLGEASRHVWPVTRSVTRSVTGDVSVVPLRLSCHLPGADPEFLTPPVNARVVRFIPHGQVPQGSVCAGRRQADREQQQGLRPMG